MLCDHCGQSQSANHRNCSAYGKKVPLKDRCCLEKDRMALRRGLSEFGGAALVGELECTERRLVTIHKDRLDIVAIDG